jgi:hypothetical protein
MIPNIVKSHAKYCEEMGDMQRIHTAVREYFVDNLIGLTPMDAFVLGQLYNSSSVDDAEWIYNDYCNK